MNDKLNEAFNEIDDRKVAEAAQSRRHISIGAIAAILALVLALGTILPLIHYNRDGSNTHLSDLSNNSALLAAPEYPELVQRPNEADYMQLDNWSAFSEAYSAWSESQQKQHNQPEGYADSLDHYFRKCIPLLLSEDENAACSPVNLYMALAMLAETTEGDSREQILSLLGAQRIDSLREQADDVWNAHYNDDGVSETLLGNSLWLRTNINYDMSTVRTLAENYHASVFQGALGSDEMNDLLHAWLNEQTKNLLSDSVKDERFDSDTMLSLASTIYYRANWQDAFSEKQTIKDRFTTLNGKSCNVEYLCRSETQTYYRGENFGAISLYLMDGCKMWLILPDEGFTPSDVLENDESVSLMLGDANCKRTSYKVHLRLPKFDISSQTDLKATLTSLGVADVFDPTLADFSAIAPDNDLYLDKATHSARVKIDEEGVEAAAYTLFAVEATGAVGELEEIDFYLDRPFLFCISSQDDLPLFVGTVCEP